MPPKAKTILVETTNPDAYADAMQQNRPKPEDGYFAGHDFCPPFPTEEAKAPFAIDCEDHADWYLSKLAAIDAEADLMQSQHEQRMKRLMSDRQNLENLFGSQLETWTRRQIMQDKKGRKSVILPHGTCQIRTVPAGLKVTDTQEALTFAKVSLPEVVRTVETLDLTAYRQRAESRMHSDGEMLPGVEYVGERESFSIKFGKVDR